VALSVVDVQEKRRTKQRSRHFSLRRSELHLAWCSEVGLHFLGFLIMGVGCRLALVSGSAHT
jgi:hypothetical protein